MSEIIDWLLSGDVAIQFQTKRDLLNTKKEDLIGLQERISRQGWGRAFLDKRDNRTGLWGNGFYSPKWISTHYTLLDLKNLGLSPNNQYYLESSEILLNKLWFDQGRVRKYRYQDVCVAAMLISICCYAQIKSEKIFEIIDYIIEKHYPDGGWNCDWEKGDCHSSLHTTLSVLEAIRDFRINAYTYRLYTLQAKIPDAHEFILKHKLYMSHRTGEIIDKKMLMLSYPGRWKYDILRCLDYFQSIDAEYDSRLDPAIDIIIKKRRNNKWPLQQKYSGLIHFDMEKPGHQSRWNTLRALRVLKKYRNEEYRE